MRKVPILAASAAAASLLCGSGANAQLQREVAPLPPTSSVTVIEPARVELKGVEGTVTSLDHVDRTPTREIVTVLRLDNNTDLIVPEFAKAPGTDVRVGSRVVADYVNTGDRKTAVFLRDPDMTQAP